MLDLFPRVQPGPPRPSRILNPRDLQRKSGMERYEIPGGGALMVEIDAGDALILRNAEGGQVAEMLAADASGAIDSGVIGVKADSTGEGLKALIAAGGPGMARLRAGLTRRGIDLSRAKSLSLFGAGFSAFCELRARISALAFSSCAFFCLLMLVVWKNQPRCAARWARMAFCTCRRFSAWSKMMLCLLSSTSAETSSPGWAGRQCMK